MARPPAHTDPTALPAGAAPSGGQAYLAAEGFLDELLEELGRHGEIGAVHGRLVLAPGPPRPAAWAANVWLDPLLMPVQSIGHAARCLRALQRNWSLHSVACHRRAALVAERLPHVSARPLVFPAAPPAAPLGAFTLLDEHTLLAAPRCSSPVPDGAYAFVEDHQGPPNRAYLKLWEAFTRLGSHPGPGQRCLDLGASPGGWTWVLARLGASVLAVDRAALADAVAALPEVTSRRRSAFSLSPGEVGSLDWLVSDVVCYPERLLGLVRRWLDSGLCPRFVCTLKFQGSTDHDSAQAFAALPHSRLLHLQHNKHELTWLRAPELDEG